MRFAQRIRQFWDDLFWSRHERDLLAQVEYHKNRQAIAEGKCERMELVLMPLTSRAGGLYAGSTTKRLEGELKRAMDAPLNVGMPTYSGSWASIQADFEKEQKAELAKEKSNGHGVRNERTAEQEA